jgi:hypothetical protein
VWTIYRSGCTRDNEMPRGVGVSKGMVHASGRLISDRVRFKSESENLVFPCLIAANLHLHLVKNCLARAGYDPYG